jgi:hypothetical protein
VSVEIRKHKRERTIDEVVANGVDFHIEQMSDNSYWFCLTSKEGEWHFWLTAPAKARLCLSCSESPTPPRSYPMSEWSPIETAPKDRCFLAWCPGHAILVWDQVVEKFVSNEDGEWTPFQAWTPLPDPPTVGIYHDGESWKVLPK